MTRSVGPSLLLSLLLGFLVNGWAMAGDTLTDAGASSGNTSTGENKRTESDEGLVFGSAAPPVAYPAASSEQDPWESVNRKIFGFNESVDDYIMRPVAEGYRWVMPDPIEIAVGNVFSNLNDIPI